MLRIVVSTTALGLAGAAAQAADFENLTGQFAGDFDIAAAYVAPEGENDGFGLGAGGNGVWKFGETGFNAEGGFRYSKALVDEGDTEFGRAGVKGFWRSPDTGLFGAELAYESIGAGNFDSDIFKYGLMAQIYGSEIVTFSINTGLYDGEDNDKKSLDGYYLQGGVNFYLNDRVATGIGGTYMEVDGRADDIMSLTLRSEYLLPTSMPMSVSLGYNYSDVTTIQTHAAVLGFKLYFGGGEGDTLATIHRNGSANNGNPALPLFGY